MKFSFTATAKLKLQPFLGAVCKRSTILFCAIVLWNAFVSEYSHDKLLVTSTD